nr:hypothetical protein [uncultured Allomuricauda sp.]
MKVEFTKNYATLKKGDVREFDSIMAHKFINRLKVAKAYKEKSGTPSTETKNGAPNTENK